MRPANEKRSRRRLHAGTAGVAGTAAGLLLGLAAVGLAPPARADDEGGRLAALLRDAAPSVVTVKVLARSTVQARGKSADHDLRYEVPGVVVDASGLIMTSIEPFAPERMMEMIAPGSRQSMPEIKTVPSEIKVFFEQDEKENDAFLAATDSNLGLAFLQLEGPAPDRKLKAADFSHPATVAVGDLVAAVSRLGRGYDAPAFFETARISGQITKPRRAWLTDRSFSTLGLPVLAADGRVAGILAIVASGTAESEPAEMGLSAMMRLLTGGGSPVRPVIVPAPAVAALIEQARQQAVEKAAERAARKAAPPAPEPPPH